MNEVLDPPEGETLDAIPVGPGPGRTVAIALAWISVGLIVGLGLWLFWTQVVDPSGSSAVDSYVSGDGGEVYRSRADGFKVEMPTTPTRRQQRSIDGTTVVVESRPGPGYAFSVTNEPQTQDALANYTATLDTAAGSLTQQAGGELVSQTVPQPFGKIALKDFVFRKGQEYYRTSLLLTADRLYTVQARVKGKDTAPFKRLTKSFQVLGPG